MNEHAIPAHDELPFSLVQHLDQVCSAFEAACQAAGASGPFPMIEGFLDGCIDSERSLLLHVLILLEVHYRRRSCVPARADVERLVERKLRKHGGDLKASLAEVSSEEVHKSLSGISDTGVQHSLACVPPASGQMLATTHTFQLGCRDRYTLSRLHAKGGL